MEREDGDGMMERTEYIEKWKVVNMLIDVENRAQGTYRENGEKLYRDLVETEIKIGKFNGIELIEKYSIKTPRSRRCPSAEREVVKLGRGIPKNNKEK